MNQEVQLPATCFTPAPELSSFVSQPNIGEKRLSQGGVAPLEEPPLAMKHGVWTPLWLLVLVDSTTLRASTKAREAEACDCGRCQGERLLTDHPTDGFKGFQCKPRAAAVEAGSCAQQGDPSTWVVQTAAEVTYERFCYFTCKPVIPKAITPDISCTHLSPADSRGLDPTRHAAFRSALRGIPTDSGRVPFTERQTRGTRRSSARR